jgi:hypothetical protein
MWSIFLNMPESCKTTTYILGKSLIAGSTVEIQIFVLRK